MDGVEALVLSHGHLDHIEGFVEDIGSPGGVAYVPAEALQNLLNAEANGDHCGDKHVELETLKYVSSRYGRHLPEFVLYSTHEPCAMCAGACVWCRIGAVVYGISKRSSPLRDRLEPGQTLVSTSLQLSRFVAVARR
jgi:tRNA(Arg) A34 adenosine deaminase TadA